MYPDTSHLPHEAAERFTERANELTASAPLRFEVDRHGFRVAGNAIAPGQGQVTSLAEALHSMQVGQLILVPGFTLEETHALIRVANTDPAEIRLGGGARNVLMQAGVTHLALVEVVLRQSDESGLFGLDPTNAPLDELATEVANAVERRAAAAKSGPAPDEVADYLAGLSPAALTVAQERLTEALLRLDEQTRVRVLTMALAADTQGRRMDSMLSTIAHMTPASLARLLRLSATYVETEPQRLASALPLSPQVLSILDQYLSPSADVAPADEVPAQESAAWVAQALTESDDSEDTERQVKLADPALSSARALATAVSVSKSNPDVESVQAISDVLPQAAADGAFTTVRVALRRLDEIGADPQFRAGVAEAQHGLAAPEVLAAVCKAPKNDADAAIAGEILQAAGAQGAEALLSCYIRSTLERQSLMRPVMRTMSGPVISVARDKLRAAEPGAAAAIVRSLSTLGDKRAVPVVSEMVDHLDESVRFAAVKSLALMGSPEAATALARALNHREPETQRFVVREIGAARIASAVPALSRALEDVNVFSRTYETRKEIVHALELIGTPEAEKALRAYAQHTIRLSRKTRELRKQAIAVADNLARNRGVSAP